MSTQDAESRPPAGSEHIASPPPRQLAAWAAREAAGSKIVDFYRNRSVLITGGSGFIGKVLIEKLLRTCPELRRIYVLVRPKWNKKPKERIEEILKARLFDGVRESLLDANSESRVVCVEGDVMEVNLGLSEQNLLRIMNDVSVIYHSAATVKFDEPLKQSIAINIAGTKNMIEVCRKIPQLAALVHVSTAYANCDLPEVDEHVYPVNIDPEKLIDLAGWMEQGMMQELKKHLLGLKPNTYTYTKAIAEWLLIKCASDLPVVICRPSIVCASWREPFRGWIDNVNGPTGVILGAGKGLVRSMYAESSFIADLVPVDTVINLVVTLGWFASVYSKHKTNNNEAQLSSSPSSASVDNNFNANSESSADESFESRDHLAIPRDQLNRKTAGSCSSESDIENNNNNNNNNDDNQINDLYSAKRDNHRAPDSHLNLLKSRKQQLLAAADDGYSSQASSLDQPPYSIQTNSSKSDSPAQIGGEKLVKENDQEASISHQRVLSFVKQHRIAQQGEQAAFEYKLKQFRHNLQTKLSQKKLPKHLADVPVFHCTSGDKRPISWGEISVFVISICAIFPSSTTYRFPSGSFTNKTYLDNFYRLTLHYLPAYVLDFITKLAGGRPILVKIYRKFDQASNVLKAFTTKQWKFKTDNQTTLLNELMSEEDRRLFDFDITNLNWQSYITGYVLGVREFLLKEPISNLEEARRNLKLVYYRNLSIQVLFTISLLYYFFPSDYLSLY